MSFPAGKTIDEPLRVRALNWFLLCLFVVQSLLVAATRLCGAQNSFSASHWPEALMVVLAAATTLTTLLRGLPLQNVLLASFIIASDASLVQMLTAAVGEPFKAVVSGNRFWPVPLVWVIAILNARGAARFALARWRASSSYGLWLFGLSGLLAVLFVFGSQYFEKAVRNTVSRIEPQSIFSASGIAWLDSAGAVVTALIGLLLATPSLVNKHPVERPPDKEPMFLWLYLNLLFAWAASCHGKWMAVAVIAGGNALIFGFTFAKGFRKRTLPRQAG
jgi:hypothetical protein